MPTFAVLLRGVNVGGRNRLPMSELRDALDGDGIARVRTYIQSGNVVVDDPTPDAEAIAARVRMVIAREFGLDVPAIGIDSQGLADVLRGNPFPQEPDPRRLHALFLPSEPTRETLALVASRESSARAKGGNDAVVVVGRTAYLHTPDGLGLSDLARALTSGRANPLAAGTARNWSTVTTLLALCGP